MSEIVEEPPIVIGSREQLLHLLAEAAEIEHTLMCSYLYAAFSLKRPGEGGLSGRQSEAVARWRKVIMSVATEEMGHLLGVANLTVAIGGRPHLGRPNFPIAPGYFPSGVAVRLRPFDRETLKHFIFLERPQGVEGEESDAFEQTAYSREQALAGLMPSAQDYETIGHLYRALRQNLEALHHELGHDGLFLGGIEGQVGPEVAAMEGVGLVRDIADARAILDTIVEQGEGSTGERDQSHYRSFLSIEEEHEAWLLADPSCAPAWPAAENPVLRRPAEEDHDRVFVDAPKAAKLLDYGCAAYGVLVRTLVQLFGRKGSDSIAEQKTLFDTAISLMHIVAAAGDALARLPASRAADGPNAGLTFTMLRGVEALLPQSEWSVLKERLEALANAAGAVGLEIAGPKPIAALDLRVSGFGMSGEEALPA